ncbi:Non-specific serine/threonine protein kinase [Heracleum sosnowskyi]|uniref:non-specific serine/threonine protein kinase n=1 Tax=Heracleum sosnowskyi TaxID=360622 RepID=A0AAD8N0N7_9APIA|nr:Non-specific serine/threonine protein kinase [Heracleum sosnowskyi]
MWFRLVILILFGITVSSQQFEFFFNDFKSNNLSLEGDATFTPNGLLKLSGGSNQHSHAFYPNQINLKKNPTNSSVSSFSTTFVFAIVSEYSKVSSQGMTFFIAPTKFIHSARPEYFGLTDQTSDGNATNHFFAVELDTSSNDKFDDIDANHVGIDINSLKSNISRSAGYYSNGSCDFVNLTLYSRLPMQVWVEYSGSEKHVDVTLAPLHISKPTKPLLSLDYDLDSVLNKEMYVGFSCATGARLVTSHYVLGWSFMVNGIARDLDLSKLPMLPRIGPKRKSKFLTIGLPLILGTLMFMTISCTVYYIRRKMKFAEVLEDWELEYGPHRFKYKDLYVATKGFKDKELLGKGGFGKVYRGVLPTSKVEIAVKRVSHDSRQGIREFVAEIVSIGRLRHRNIVPLLGYCRRRSELLLVYDYMPNGSLDKALYDQPKFRLNWRQRFQIIKGVAAGLSYLHQDWEKVVIHRDVKASNVLLDNELNGRLGDFGLARLYDHGTDPQTTHVVGTIGYLAPEHNRTGKATTSTDVYSFGAFLLEVACGKRPIYVQHGAEDIILADWVCSCWNRNDIVASVDPNLGAHYVKEEVELVLKLGLLCCNSEPSARPRMQQVVQYLGGYAPLPELSSIVISSVGLAFAHDQNAFSNIAMSNYSSSSVKRPYSQPPSVVADSFLSGGR